MGLGSEEVNVHVMVLDVFWTQ
jgi:hypothetical protein